MRFIEENEKLSPIFLRALSLSIGKEFTQRRNGKVANASDQGGEQHFQRRELLEVEQEARKNKIIREHGENHFKKQLMEQFYSRVLSQVNSEFDNKEQLFNQTLAIESASTDILEILSLRAASINRIAPLVKSLSWLSKDVINLVNKPQYRKRADVQVTDSNLALSYIGLDNLKLIMPTFILKHWLPNTTAPFPLMKRRLWNTSLSVGIASQALAQIEGLDDYTAFAAGMFSNLGYLAVTKCFLTTHNSMYNKAVREAYENKDKKLHNTLLEFDSCPDILLEQMTARSSDITANMIELMHLDRLHITEAMFDLAYLTDLSKMSPLAKIILQAKAYITFRTLVKEDMITPDEAKPLLAAVQLSTQKLALLKKTDVDHLKLNFK